MDALIDLSDASVALDLSRIRTQLIRLEDTITFYLIERVQFPLNHNIYVPGAVPIPNSTLSLMDWYLLEQEKLQSLIRRYESPDEYPFFPDLINRPILQPLSYPKILHKNNVNVNTKIKEFYVKEFLPKVCPNFGRDDRGVSLENYGSSATADIACLQALSRRIHFGKFVAESKFQQNKESYTAMIKASDREGLGNAIENKAVEAQVLARLRLKAQTYGTDPSLLSAASRDENVSKEDKKALDQSKINVEAVVAMYKDFVIPITKEVEVEYLMQRLLPE